MDIDIKWLESGTVTIAGRRLSDFCAKMLSYPQFSKTYDVETFQGRQRSTMSPIKNLITGMSMTARIDFTGTNEARTAAQSAFEALFRSQTQPVEIDIGDGYFYRSVLLSAVPILTSEELITTVEYSWRVTRHKAAIEISLYGENRLWCPSNVDRTDCVLTILDGVQQGYLLNVKLNGLEYTVQSADNPENDEIVLDGVGKSFKIGGASATQKVEWRDFPFLVPGENVIDFFLDTAPVAHMLFAKVSFTPTYL